jgi:hypothetical integral membrane protein (TIGR02206 family)
MTTNFRFLGLAHFLIIAAVVFVAAVFALVQRNIAPGARWLRISLGVVLMGDSAFWYTYLAVTGQRIFPSMVPIELCDVTLYLVALVLFTRSAALFDIAYYWALAGSSMALITPDVTGHFPSIATVQFFVEHGLCVSGVLYLVWSRQARPRPGSIARTMIAGNLLAVFDGVFDWKFKTDFMYICAKPARASLLNILGPWPWYIATSEGVALILFLLLYLPFWRWRLADAAGK